MSDKEESASVANPAAPAQDKTTTKTDSAADASAEDPKIEKLEISAPAAEEKREEAVKPAESELAKGEDQATKQADGKHSLSPTILPYPTTP